MEELNHRDSHGRQVTLLNGLKIYEKYKSNYLVLYFVQRM